MKFDTKKTIFVFVLGFMLVACAPAIPTPTITPPPPPELKITYPVDGGKVNVQENIKGTSARIPSDQTVWVVIFVNGVNRYFPQNNAAQMEANGNWSSPVTLGQSNDSGVSFEIIAVSLDQSARDAFEKYLKDARDKSNYSGLEALPTGAKIYQRIAVQRQ